MKLNSKIKSTRIDTETKELMKSAIETFNLNESGFQMSESSFIRQALKFYAKKLLNEGISFEFKPNGHRRDTKV